MNRTQMLRARLSANDLVHELSALLAVDGGEGYVFEAKTKFYDEHAFEALERIATEMGFGIVALPTEAERLANTRAVA